MKKFELLTHVWKSLTRSIVWYRQLGANIVMGVLFAVLGLNLLSIGLFIDTFFRLLFPGQNPLFLVHGVIPYYLLADLLMRAMLQKAVDPKVTSYLLLPIRRSTLARFLLGRSLVSLFNLFPFFIVIPFAIKIVAPVSNGWTAAAWLFAMAGLVGCNHFLYILLERWQVTRPGTTFAGIFMLAILVALDRFHVFSFSSISRSLWQTALFHPLLFLLPLILCLGFYVVCLRVLKSHFYLDVTTRHNEPSQFWQNGFRRLEELGSVGMFVALELKLLLRNKRSRSSFYMALSVLALIPFMKYSIYRTRDYYPQPPSPPQVLTLSTSITANDRWVTFCVRPGSMPASAHLYLTGDQPILGPWRPNHIPLLRMPDSSWCRRVPLLSGTTVRYIITMGSWQNEMKKMDDKEPDVRLVQVRGDTVIYISSPRWGQPRHEVTEDIMVIYMGVLFTGFLMILYGQFLFAWESSYFDLVISRPVSLRHYIQAKWILLLFFALVSLVLYSPMTMWQRSLLPVHLALFSYNIGINAPLLLMWATMSRKRFDLNASIYSTQGKSASIFTTIVPTLLLPILAYLFVGSIWNVMVAQRVLAGLGLIGLLCSPVFLTWAHRLFEWQKYKMATGFRQP